MFKLSGVANISLRLIYMWAHDKVGCFQHIYLISSIKNLLSYIDSLSKCTGDMQISKNSYNVFCYADDLVLTSLNVTRLQDFINSAKSFIVSHGLNFDPSKTVCTTLGHTVFERTPSSTLDGTTQKRRRL